MLGLVRIPKKRVTLVVTSLEITMSTHQNYNNLLHFLIVYLYYFYIALKLCKYW